ncbi:ArsR/SmtB family transcription factor [Knoellia koreensis]|uniref:Winged helix-turn-helix transcriptional regulator n=1 Tax=Knoellia koreensis TaxID=2730921 RepID=A0A849HFQ3_9MICO|nr:winged helix-turn-helix domain-containing protein [Knoellia sp. DB2414S]NNM45061.1 winged helix-turn-helix transcriptional regulator [Knoellia sp. DB2414S]
MRRVHLGTDGLAGVRWQVSPLADLAALMRLGVAGQRHPVFGWVRPRVCRVLADARAEPVRVLLPEQGRGPFPLVSPPPLRGHESIDDELAIVDALDHDAITTSCEWLDQPEPVRRRLDPWVEDDSLGHRLAASLAFVWRELLASDWAMLQRRLERHLADTSMSLARNGMADTLAHLAPGIEWVPGGDLLIDKPWPGDYDGSTKDFVLIPSLFALAEPLTDFDNDTALVLQYGIGPVDHAADAHALTDAPAASAQLIGRTRAEVLDALTEPGTTSQLSRRLGLPLSTVSTHLGVLRRAGLVTRRREGRSVVYHRSAWRVASFEAG